MKRSEVLSAFFIAMVLTFSFCALASSQNKTLFSSPIQGIYTAKPILFSAPLFAGVSYKENPSFLNQQTRMEIYDFIKSNPGIHFRGICTSLSMPIGLVQYHLSILSNAGLLLVLRDGRYKRYFESKRFTADEMKVISLLRHETAGKILAILLEKQAISHKALASTLKISSQALTWQMNRLKEEGLINSANEEMKVLYSLDEESAAIIRRYIDFIRR